MTQIGTTTEKLKKGLFYYLVVFLFIINIALIEINIGVWILAAKQNLFIAADFTNFYTGFKMIVSGDGANLYDLNLQAQYQQAIMKDVIYKSGLLPYNTPPFVAILFSPIGLIPIHIAYYIWSVGEIGLLIWAILLLNRLCAHWTKNERLLMISTFLAFWPLALTFTHGQFSLVFVICMIKLYLAIAENKLAIGGVWLSALVIKPQLLPLPGSITLNKKYRLAALTAALSVVILIIFSLLFVRFSTWVQYFKVVPEMMNNFGEFGFLPEIQYTLRGILTNILGYSQAHTINIIALVAFGFSLVCNWLLWVQRKGNEKSTTKLFFAFTITMTLFFSLHAYAYDDLLMVIPAILFFDYLRERGHPQKGYLIFILVTPLIFFIAEFTNFSLFGIFQLPVIILLAMLIWIAYYIIFDRRVTQILQI
jgi:Glycosyltransferase family 87